MELLRGSPAFFRYCKQYMEVHHPDIIVIIMELRVDPMKLQNTLMVLFSLRGEVLQVVLLLLGNKIKLIFPSLRRSFNSCILMWLLTMRGAGYEDLRCQLWDKLLKVALENGL